MARPEGEEGIGAFGFRDGEDGQIPETEAIAMAPGAGSNNSHTGDSNEEVDLLPPTRETSERGRRK